MTRRRLNRIFGRGRGRAAVPTNPSGLVGPGANWNGVAGSGFAGGVSPTPSGRSIVHSNKVAEDWWRMSFQYSRRDVGYMGRILASDQTTVIQPGTLACCAQFLEPAYSEGVFTSDQLIIFQALAADVNGGIDGIEYVDFNVEGNVQRVTTRTSHQLGAMDSTGNMSGRPIVVSGYAITLDHSAFIDGAVDISATAHSNNPAIADRTCVLRLYRRSTEYDVIYRVPGDYATVQAALAACTANNLQQASIGIVCTADQNIDAAVGISGANMAYSEARRGLITVDANGFNVTMSRATNGTFRPVMNNIRWRGISIDFANITEFYIRDGEGYPHILEGCEVYSSLGYPDFPNGSRRSVPFAYSNMMLVRCIVHDADHINAPIMTNFGNYYHTMPCDVGHHGHYTLGINCYNYSHNVDAEPIRTPTAALQLAYNGAGTATYDEKTPTNTRGLTLKVNGSAVQTFATADLAPTIKSIQAMADAINAYGNGWSATVLEPQASRLSAWYIGLENVSASPVNQPVSRAVTTAAFPHVDTAQTADNALPAFHDNVLVQGNIWQQTNAQFLLWNGCWNSALIQNIGFQKGDAVEVFISQFNGTHRHMIYAMNIVPDQQFYLRQAGNFDMDSTCRIINNVLERMTTDNSAGGAPAPAQNAAVIANNHALVSISPFFTDPTNTTGGTVAANYPGWISTGPLNDAANFTPAAGESIRANLKPRAYPLDILGNAYAELAPAGPIA